MTQQQNPAPASPATDDVPVTDAKPTESEAPAAAPVDEPVVEGDDEQVNGDPETAEDETASDEKEAAPATQAGGSPLVAPASPAASNAAAGDVAEDPVVDEKEARFARLRASIEAPGHQIGDVIEDARGCLSCGLSQIAVDSHGRVWALEYVDQSTGETSGDERAVRVTGTQLRFVGRLVK